MTSTVPPDGASLHRYPGTSCLATISLSLRDKSHSPIEAPHNYLSAYGGKPWAGLCYLGPSGGLNAAKQKPRSSGN